MNHTPWIIKDRKINIALVGCGRISQNHLQAIQAHSERITLTAVCDTNPQVLQESLTLCGVDGYSNLDDLIQNAQVDLIAVCTPSGIHAQQTIKIAQARIHILTEKPMATRWHDGIEMVKACDNAAVRLFVVKQNRLNATVQLVKKAIQEGRFGKIYTAAVNVFWTRPQHYYDQASWRGTWEFDGGAFMNQASHYVDLMQWLLGPVESVQSMMSTLARRIETEDTGVMTLKWRNGAIGSIQVSLLTYPKNFEGSITILGEKGTVRVGGVALNTIQHWEFADKRPEDEFVTQANYQSTSVYGYGHSLYYDNVINTLQGKEEPMTDGREGLASLELLIAAHQAAKAQKTIYLPLER